MLHLISGPEMLLHTVCKCHACGVPPLLCSLSSVSETPTEFPARVVWCGAAVADWQSTRTPLSQLQVALPASISRTATTAPQRQQQQAGKTTVAGTMAMARPCLLVLLSLAALATVHVDGGAAAPAPSADCMDALVSLAGCLSYVQEGSTVTTPDPSCCSGLKDVVKKEVACLCQAFQSDQDYGVALNMTKALQLPDACKVKTPPFSKCHISLPGEAPAPAPSSGAPFFGQPPSSSSPAPSAGTGGESTSSAPSPSPSRSDAVGISSPTFFAAGIAVAALLVLRVL